MKKYYSVLILSLMSVLGFSQGYDFGIVHISDYNFKIVAIPDFDSTGDTDVSDVGFTLMLPSGTVDVTNLTSILGGKTPTMNEVDAAALTGLGLGDGTRDAFFLVLSNTPSAIFSHTNAQQIDLVSFQVTNNPITGEMTLLENSDPIAVGLGGAVDSFYNSNIDATTTQDYFMGFASGMETFLFSTLSVKDDEIFNYVNVYPNPVSDFIFINSSLELDKLTLHDINGKFVLESNQTSRLDVRELSAGIYFLKIHLKNENYGVKRIVVSGD